MDEVFAAFVTEDSPGGAVIVVQDGQVLHEAGYGLADLDQGTPITPRHIFHLGSTGKQFTGLAIMMLAEQGQLDYDDPVGKHLPELARFGDAVTIRTLLHHASGIPDYYEDDDLSDRLFAESDAPDNQDALDVLAAGELQFTPGRKFAYSNTGYDTLASVVERLSGQSFADFMQARVFGPLGMKDTFSLPDSRRSSDPRVCHSYTLEDGEAQAYDSDPLDNLVGSGSIYSTVEDMARYDEALYTERLVTQATLAEAFAPATLNDGEVSPYGFGWNLATIGGEAYAGHSGAWLAFLSDYVRVPARHLAAIVLLNRDYHTPDDIAAKIVKIYLK